VCPPRRSPFPMEHHEVPGVVGNKGSALRRGEFKLERVGQRKSLHFMYTDCIDANVPKRSRHPAMHTLVYVEPHRTVRH